MKEIKTVLDLLTLIHNVDVGIVNQSTKKHDETVLRAGIKCLAIAL